MKLLPIALCAVMSFGAIGSAYAGQPVPTTRDAAKVKAIRALLDVTGQVKLSQQAMNQMIGTMKLQNTQLPQEFWDRAQKKFDANDLIELLIPVYDKYYTREDVVGLVAFYKTPLGRKVIATQSKITSEAITIGQAWGQKKAMEILQDMQKQSPTEKSSRRILPAPLAS